MNKSVSQSVFPAKTLITLITFNFLFSLASLVILIIAVVNVDVVLYGGGPERRTDLIKDLNLAIDVLSGRRK